MKRSPLKRKTPLRAKKGLQKKSKLAKRSKSSVSKTKEDIQALLRLRAIERDGGCILRHYDEAGECGGYRNDGGLILQAEHLNGRSHSVSYGDMDNIVCLCKYHHIFFKKQNNALYWLLVRRHVGEERWKKVEGFILDRTPHRMTAYDWQIIKHSLIRENDLP